jgi:acetamidase/formamidase
MDGRLKLKIAIGLALSGVAFGIGAITLQQMSVSDQLRVVPQSQNKGMTHILPATMETTQWGWFDNSQAPVLRVNPGDTVVLETMMHSHNQVVPGVTIEEIKKLRTDHPGRGPHTVTGPIYVDGAEPGDVLTVRINKIVPRAYATNFNVPGMFGQFPKEFQDGQVKYFYLDWDRKVAEFAPGIEIPLRPFPGTTGVARAEVGRYSTVPPGPYAGNMDIRDFTAGATLYVPVFVKGALLWSGDSHAAQGNGEVNLTALETAYREMNITVDVIKGKGGDMAYPRIETPTHWITMGYDNDLNKAWADARAETIKFIAEQRKVSAEKAAELMPQISDCRISQVVNIKKGVHCLTPKDQKAKGIPERPATETAAYLVTHSLEKDLNKSMDNASMGMITTLQEKKGLTRLDAYGLASMTMDCRLGKMSDDAKAVHCVLPKSIWVARK